MYLPEVVIIVKNLLKSTTLYYLKRRMYENAGVNVSCHYLASGQITDIIKNQCLARQKPGVYKLAIP